MSDTSIRYVRMLENVPRLPRRVSCRELMEKLAGEGFHISKRTVERDLEKLSAWFPIVGDGASPQGWFWTREARGFELPAMSPATALAFLMLNEFSRSLLPNNLRGFLDEHLDRARGVLDEISDRQPGLSKWSDLVAIAPRSQPLLPPAGDEEAIRVAYDALLERQRFQAVYHSASRDGEPKTYNINPLGLVLRDHLLYLVCTLFDYSDIRLLALHRMKDAELLDESAWWPDGFSLDDYVRSGVLEIVEGPEIELVADFQADAARHLSETPLSNSQKIERVDENMTRVTARVLNTKQLKWWLLGFGDAVTVILPKALRDDMAATARRMMENYS